MANPLQDAIIAEGKARGLQPYQIAAVLGSAGAESGFDTSIVGDGGKSMGGFQWNGPRLDNLRAYALQQGTPWNDPTTQAKFAYEEMQTPDGGGAWDKLLGAKSPQDAVHAMLAFERPSGYDPNDPTKSAGYNRRVELTNKALQDLGAGDLANIPVAGGTPTSFQMPPGALSPSALFGQGALADTDTEPTFGERLQRIGAALMARDNPTGAAAITSGLNSQLAARRKSDTASLYKSAPIQAYQLAVSQGYKGTFLEYLADQTRAQMSPDKAITPQDRQNAKYFGKIDEEIDQGASKAAEMNQILDAAQAVIDDPNFRTGIGESFAQKAKALGAAAGLGDTAGLAGPQLLDKLRTQMMLKLRDPKGGFGGLPGATSDRDLEFLGKGTFGIDNAKEANQLIIDYYRAIPERAMTRAQMRDAFKASTGGKLDYRFIKDWNDYERQHPLVSDDFKNKLKAFQQKAAPVENPEPSTAPRPSGGTTGGLSPFAQGILDWHNKNKQGN